MVNTMLLGGVGRFLASVFLYFLCLSLPSAGLVGQSLLPKSSVPFFVDANDGTYDIEDATYHMRGGVTFLYKDYFLYTDSLSWHTDAQAIEAKGSVVLIHDDSYFIGRRLTFNLRTQGISIWDGQLVLNSAAEASLFKNELFFSIPRAFRKFVPLRKKYEIKKRRALAEIKKQIYNQYQSDKRLTQNLPLVGLMETYRVLADEIKKIRNNAHFIEQKLTQAQRENIKSRIQYFQRTRSAKLPFSEVNLASRGFVSIQGRFITTEKQAVEGESESESDGSFVIMDGKASTCHCALDEQAPWSVAGHRIDVTIEGYVSVLHPLFLINDFPVLYLPWVKLPIKSRRQSGFIDPTISHSKRTGAIYRSHYYHVINAHQDATASLDFYEKKGWRLGGEYRYAIPRGRGGLRLQGISDDSFQNQYTGSVAARKNELMTSDRYLDGDASKQSELLDQHQRRFPSLSQNRYFFDQTHRQVLADSDIQSMFRAKTQLVSDHMFFYDFADNTDFIRRFLNTEASVNFGLDDVYADIRGSYKDDLNIEDNRLSIQRLPEMTVRYPYHALGPLPIFVSTESTFNRFNRVGGAPYEDTLRDANVIKKDVTVVEKIKNGIYDKGELIYEADRYDNRLQLSFPLPQNNFVSGSYDVYVHHRTYRLPSSLGFPTQRFLKHRFSVYMPLDAVFIPLDDLKIEHVVTPRITWSHVPNVYRQGIDQVTWPVLDTIDITKPSNTVTVSLSTELNYKRDAWKHHKRRLSPAMVARQHSRPTDVFAALNEDVSFQHVHARAEKRYCLNKKIEKSTLCQNLNPHKTLHVPPPMATFDRSEFLNDAQRQSDSLAINYQRVLAKKGPEKHDEVDESPESFDVDLSDDMTHYRRAVYTLFPEEEPRVFNNFRDVLIASEDAASCFGWGVGCFKRQQISSGRPLLMTVSQAINLSELERPLLDSNDERKPLDVMKVRLIIKIPHVSLDVKGEYQPYLADETPFLDYFNKVSAGMGFSLPLGLGLSLGYNDTRSFIDRENDDGVIEKVADRQRVLSAGINARLFTSFDIKAALTRTLTSDFTDELKQKIVWDFRYIAPSKCWGLFGKVTKEAIGNPEISWELTVILNFHKSLERRIPLSTVVRRQILGQS